MANETERTREKWATMRKVVLALAATLGLAGLGETAVVDGVKETPAGHPLPPCRFYTPYLVLKK